MAGEDAAQLATSLTARFGDAWRLRTAAGARWSCAISRVPP